jgi:hypothetical protein
MSLSRRFFLRGMSMAPAIAKGAAQTIERSVGIRTTGLGNDITDEDWGGPTRGEGNREKALIEVFKKFGGLPQWKKDEIRKEARNVHQLDVDLATMTSMSLAAKMYIQADRNERRALKRELEYPAKALERAAWLKMFDIQWW